MQLQQPPHRLALAVALNVYFIAFLKLGVMGFVLSGVIASTATLMPEFRIPSRSK